MGKDRFTFTLDHARNAGIDAAERLFKCGRQGDQVILMKGRDGRIISRDYEATEFAGEIESHRVAGADGVWKAAPQLDGLSSSELIFMIAQNKTKSCTLAGPGGEVTFHRLRTPEGAEWSFEEGWHKNGKT